MTPHVYTVAIEGLPIQEAAMLAHTGKRLTTRITDHVQQEKLQVAAVRRTCLADTGRGPLPQPNSSLCEPSRASRKVFASGLR